MNKNWTVSNGTLYRANHNGTAKGYAIGSVKHITEEQIEAFCKVASAEKTIKEKVAKAKELIATLPPDTCPTCGHKLSKPKTITEKGSNASRLNGLKGGRPQPKFSLLGFTSFAAGESPKKAVIISTHGSRESLEKAYNSDKSGLCLEWKEWQSGERAGMDATEIIKNRQ